MYKVRKRMEIAGAHLLELPYKSKCQALHGHNWIVEVYCAAEELNESGMIEDFTLIKERVMEMDHCTFIREEAYVSQKLPGNASARWYYIDFNPTAENIAKHICDMIPSCYRVDVQESEGNVASYVDELAYGSEMIGS